MAWWIDVSEITIKNYKGEPLPTGKYCLTKTSDEGAGTWGLCKHKHRTKEAARNCREANRNAKKI